MHGYVATEADIARLEAAAKAALAAKADLAPPSAALPAIATANGRLEASPPGLVFSVKGNSTTAIGDSYSEQVIEFYGAVRAPNSNEPGAVVPDGLLIERRSDGDAAIEAKYTQNWFKSSYYIDPETGKAKIPFGDQVISETVQQALKYAKAYPTGVRWVTNSPEFAAADTAKFLEANVNNFSFVVIPAVREGRDGSYPD